MLLYCDMNVHSDAVCHGMKLYSVASTLWQPQMIWKAIHDSERHFIGRHFVWNVCPFHLLRSLYIPGCTMPSVNICSTIANWWAIITVNSRIRCLCQFLSTAYKMKSVTPHLVSTWQWPLTQNILLVFTSSSVQHNFTWVSTTSSRTLYTDIDTFKSADIMYVLLRRL